MKELKFISKDKILVGDLITTLVKMSTATVSALYLLQSKTLYQLINIAGLTISILVGQIITPEHSKILYKHLKKIYLLESIIKIVAIIVLLVYKNSSLLLIGIIAIISAPLSTIQKYNNITLVNTIYNTEARKLHDIYSAKYGVIAQAIAMGIGFIVNVFVPPYLAYAIAELVEIVNNIFYLRQKPLAIDNED